MNRSFVLPLSALAFGAVACNGAEIDEDADTGTDGSTDVDTDAGTEAPDVEPLIGNWNATRVQSGPYDIEFPIEYTYDNGPDSYTSIQTISLEVTPALASLVQTQLVTDANGSVDEEESYSESYSGTWSTTGPRSYLLAIEADMESVDLACTVDAEDELVCSADFEDAVVSYSFERSAE